MNRGEIIQYIENNLKNGYSIDSIEKSLSQSLDKSSYLEIIKEYKKNNDFNEINTEKGKTLKILALFISPLILIFTFSLVVISYSSDLYSFSGLGLYSIIANLIIGLTGLFVFMILALIKVYNDEIDGYCFFIFFSMLIAILGGLNPYTLSLSILLGVIFGRMVKLRFPYFDAKKNPIHKLPLIKNFISFLLIYLLISILGVLLLIISNVKI